jgi:predicted nucleic acid-binding protein
VIVVDSSVWIDYFNGIDAVEAERLDDYLETDVVLVGDLVLAEVLQGFRSDRDHQVAEAALTRLGVAPMVGDEMAMKAADNFRSLRRRGVTVHKTIDCLIATFCIERDHRLLFSDRDFAPFVDHLGLSPA